MRYVITGGPSVGKTTIIKLLASRGYPTVPEVSRMIIEEELKNGGNLLPWKNLALFQEEVIRRQLLLEQEVTLKETFLDRGIIDGYAYCRIGNIEPPKQIHEHGFNRYKKVFLLDPLPEYHTDAVRKEDPELARRIHQTIGEAYIMFGYDLITVPVSSPEERVEYILKHAIHTPLAALPS